MMLTQVSCDESDFGDEQPVDTDAYPEVDEQYEQGDAGLPQPSTPQSGSMTTAETMPGFSPLPHDRSDDFPKLALAGLASTYEEEEQPLPQPVHPVHPQEAIPSQVKPFSSTGQEASKEDEVSCWKIVLSRVH